MDEKEVVLETSDENEVITKATIENLSDNKGGED